MAGSLANKVAVVTGAASGIGLATARRFAREGARLVLADLNEEGGFGIARETDAVFVRTDVADLAQVEALMQAAVDRHGRLDVVFNNAGIGAYGKTPDLEPDVWH